MHSYKWSKNTKKFSAKNYLELYLQATKKKKKERNEFFNLLLWYTKLQIILSLIYCQLNGFINFDDKEIMHIIAIMSWLVNCVYSDKNAFTYVCVRKTLIQYLTTLIIQKYWKYFLQTVVHTSAHTFIHTSNLKIQRGCC